MKQADLVISADWIIPVVPQNRVFTDCCIVIQGEKIVGIWPNEDVNKHFEAKKSIHLPEHVLIPGLVNAHTHTSMSLLRGYADDQPLMTWLQEYIWPTEQKFVDESFVEQGSLLAIAEMLRSGTTCFADMYFFPEVTAKVAFESGIRSQINFPILDFANNWARSIDESMAKGMALRDAYRSHHLVDVGFGPHAPYTVSDGPLMRLSVYAEELQAPIQIHLHETAKEVTDSLEQHGKRPIERLAEMGALSPLTQCVHMTQLVESDIALLTQTGAHVVHCPESNLKLASGICPVSRLLESNVNVALGTDGAASNNDLSLLSEMKTAALLAKTHSNNASALPAHQALEMATINGAKALGMADKIGSIEAGKYADITAIDMSDITLQPIYHPMSQLVYNDLSHHVSQVWVAGKQLVKDKQLTTIDVAQLKNNVSTWQQRIQATSS